MKESSGFSSGRKIKSKQKVGKDSFMFLCGGICSQSLFDSDPWAYMMCFVMPDDIFKEYKEAREDKRKFMQEYADKLFKKNAQSMI